ncbi:hypothetical protein EON77_17090, partial [bacterium]
MFATLTERLSKAANALRGRGRLTEDNIAETLREVRLALLEAACETDLDAILALARER